MRIKILYRYRYRYRYGFGIGVGFCLLLAGCDAPLLFWEEEALKVADDALIEEAKLKHLPSQNTSSKTSHSK